MHRILTTLLVVTLFSTSTAASQLIRLEVDQKADVYEITVEMTVSAPVEQVRAILTDYANLDRLNASITSSRILDVGGDGTVRVMTRIKNCILFFCMNMKKVEDVSEDAEGRIVVDIVPDSSSFRSGRATWEFKSAGHATRVIHHALLEPGLWIPPWIGTAILKDTLRRELQESFETLDCLAQTQCANHGKRTRADAKDLFSM